MVMVCVRAMLVKEDVAVFVVFKRMTGGRARRCCAFFVRCLGVVIVATVNLAHSSSRRFADVVVVASTRQ